MTDDTTTPQGDQPASADAASPAASDDPKARFREALDRKKAESHRGVDAREDRGVGPGGNDKHTRVFRRKSG